MKLTGFCMNTFNCPNCNHSTQIGMAEDLDTIVSTEIKEEPIRSCPKCGSSLKLSNQKEIS